MKYRATYLVGVLLLAAALPTWAGPNRGQDDEHRSDRDSRYREHYEGDRDRSLGQDRQRSLRRNEAARRPLGTQHEEPRSFRGRDRYDRDAGRAANAVRRDERGRVLRSEPTDDRGYRVRVLTPDGYVRERYVDPGGDGTDHRHQDD
jgi:hypothetical protein